MVLSPTLERNRRLIVEAAVTLWAASPTASLSEVARVAGVGRTTLHRHFTDRAQLLAAVDDACREQFEQATRRARPDQGEAMEALHRLGGEYLELGDYLTLVIADQPVVDADAWDDSDGSAGSDGSSGSSAPDEFLVTLVERGHRDGSIDASLSPTWVISCFWVLLYASRLVLDTGEVSRREVAAMLDKTLGSGMRPLRA